MATCQQNDSLTLQLLAAACLAILLSSPKIALCPCSCSILYLCSGLGQATLGFQVWESWAESGKSWEAQQEILRFVLQLSAAAVHKEIWLQPSGQKDGVLFACSHHFWAYCAASLVLTAWTAQCWVLTAALCVQY